METLMKPVLIVGVIFSAFFIYFIKPANAENFEKLADAIYRAEGIHSNHPYGILQKYKTTTPRQACLNTLSHKHRDWIALGSHGDFLEYLQSKYAPLNCSNDPNHLNDNWLTNVRAFLK